MAVGVKDLEQALVPGSYGVEVAVRGEAKQAIWVAVVAKQRVVQIQEDLAARLLGREAALVECGADSLGRVTVAADQPVQQRVELARGGLGKPSAGELRDEGVVGADRTNSSPPSARPRSA